MPRNPGLPRVIKTSLSKKNLLQHLKAIDSDKNAQGLILALENGFRKKVATLVTSLPAESSALSRFNTNPYVLLLYCKQKGYHAVSQIEQDILPAKLFSSMETSAGRMVQDVALPAFGWTIVESSMHSATSVIDCRKQVKGTLYLATIKSGPKCLNDEMSKDIADDIVSHAEGWANDSQVDHIDFTYGVLYGTPRQSNKKDWHILRNIVETVGTRFVTQAPDNRWSCSFRLRNIRVDVTIRIGIDWWSFLGGTDALVQTMAALIRACVAPSSTRPAAAKYVIADLGDIVSTRAIPPTYNVSILQKSQLEWLFFMMSHFCDELGA